MRNPGTAPARPQRIYVYLLDHDLGFAPNPFHGWCTLAGCRPVIRRKADVGDWIVGITGRRGGRGNRVAYAMQVEERLTFAQYWRDCRFRAKRPREGETLPAVERRGDNRRVPREHDLSGKHVLVGQRFCYYGASAIRFPKRLARFATPGRFYRVKFSPKEQAALLAFVEGLPVGVHDKPATWPDDDESWRSARGSRRGSGRRAHGATERTPRASGDGQSKSSPCG